MSVDIPGEAGALAHFVHAHRRIVVLTGAGCSTASGIPAYRDEAGQWQHRQPMTIQRFVTSEAMRRRYWAGSLLGYTRVAEARPNAAHRALAELEAQGWVNGLVTQNVDGLHRRAGSAKLVELHGRLDTVVCMGCQFRVPRGEFQGQLLSDNRGLVASGPVAPDGDVRVEPGDAEQLQVPACPRCGGVLKPDVVFFGENVPAEVVRGVEQQVDGADAVLVVGSSLMVYSGFRFVKRAAAKGVPVAIANRGTTRADALAHVRVSAPCEELLPRVLELLAHLA